MNRIEELADKYKQQRAAICRKLNKISSLILDETLKGSFIDKRYYVDLDISAETNISLRIYDEKKEEFIEKKEIWLLGRVFESRSIILNDDDGIDKNVEEVKTALAEMHEIAKKYINLNKKQS